MSIKLLLIFFLVAIGICFLSDVFFPAFLTAGPIYSILIALAGALLITFLVAKTQPVISLKASHVFFSSLIGALVILLLAFLIDRETCNPVATAVINCNLNPPAVSDKYLEVCNDGKIIWKLDGPDQTQVRIFKFRRFILKKIPWFGQPLKQTEYTQTINGPASSITADANHTNGHFRYAATCKLPGGSPIIVDPMIDIPRK